MRSGRILDLLKNREAVVNLANVGSVTQLESLPNGVKALVWVGQCQGVDAAFLKTARPKPNRQVQSFM